MSTLDRLTRLVRYLKPYRIRLGAAFACSGLVAAFSGAYAWLVKPVLDEIFINKNESLLLILPLALFTVAVLKSVFNYGQNYLMNYVGNQVITDIRQELFGKLIRLPVSYHDANTSGRLVARVVSDVTLMANAVAGVLKDIFQQGLTFLAMMGVIFYQNWRLRAGEMVALVGSSGSGKTTLVNLIPRFYEPTAGRILIDGIDIQSYTIRSLRSQIGMVSQDVVLFDDSIRNNIAFGREDATDEDIMQAARAAYAHDFVERLPQGYHTIVGEKGVKLSGGERQRLAIARAILRDPPLLILDEATSALDTESERVVQLALANLMKNRTTVVIAHRLSTIQQADRIMVLARGSIVEVGTHDELLRRGGQYQRLHAMQFQDIPDA
ncbi:MAG: ABC transporter ATP-binding protein [Nitrospira sp.]|nr:MAG: ABC transporter ATP-binding protein [Nitrospira sp.]